jgi:hypothetical protein
LEKSGYKRAGMGSDNVVSVCVGKDFD